MKILKIKLGLLSSSEVLEEWVVPIVNYKLEMYENNLPKYDVKSLPQSPIYDLIKDFGETLSKITNFINYYFENIKDFHVKLDRSDKSLGTYTIMFDEKYFNSKGDLINFMKEFLTRLNDISTEEGQKLNQVLSKAIRNLLILTLESNGLEYDENLDIDSYHYNAYRNQLEHEIYSVN